MKCVFQWPKYILLEWMSSCLVMPSWSHFPLLSTIEFFFWNTFFQTIFLSHLVFSIRAYTSCNSNQFKLYFYSYYLKFFFPVQFSNFYFCERVFILHTDSFVWKSFRFKRLAMIYWRNVESFLNTNIKSIQMDLPLQMWHLKCCL